MGSYSRLWHFTCKSQYKVALVKSWHAFRLRRLAQSIRPRSGFNVACGILPVNFCVKWLLWNLDMRFDCAGSHKVCGTALVCSILPVNFCENVPLVKCRHAFRLRRLAQSLRRGFGLRHFTCKFPYEVTDSSEISTCVLTAQARIIKSAARFCTTAFFLRISV